MEVHSETTYFESPGKFVFHETDTENIASIQKHGIKCDNGHAYDSEDIIDILDDLGYSDPFPFDRDEVVYCHTDPEFVKGSLKRREEKSHEGIEPRNSAFVVVSVNQIDSPVYLADMSVITDLIDYRYAGPEHMMYAETPEEVIELYNDTITSVESPEDVRSYDGTENGHTELVVDGDIPPEAVVGVIS